MEKLTGKGRKRKGEAVATPEVDGETGIHPDNQFGDGEISEAGPGAPGEPIAESKAFGWADLIEAVRAEPAQVSRCWHPAPESDLVTLANGSNATAEIGAPAYQLTTGDIITL